MARSRPLRPPGRDPRRACRAVCGGLLLFVLSQIGLRLWIDARAPWVRDPEYAARLARLQPPPPSRGERPPLVVVFGSSRTEFGLKALVMQEALARDLGRPVRVHNFGLPGSSGVESLFNWRRLRRDGVRPDVVLLEVTPTRLNANCPVHELAAARHPSQRLTWGDLPLVERCEGPDRPQLREEWWMAQLVPVLGHREILLRALAPWMVNWWNRGLPGAGMNAAGDLPVHGDWLELRRTPETLRLVWEQHGFFLAHFRLGGPSRAATRELLDECRTQHVPVALVLMPEGPAYRAWADPAIYAEVRAWVRRLQQEYDCGVIDARDWIGEDGFWDSHHMVLSGALAFTDRLRREAVLPLLRPATHE
jgi:hypothetical protein